MINIYDEVKEQMKTGDHIGWASATMTGGIIRWRTKGYINHSSMIIRLAEFEGEQRRRYHTEAMERGVYPNLLSNRLKKYEGEVWWYPLKPELDEKRTEIGRRLCEMWGIEYDYKSLMWQLLGKVNADARKLFCSEVCYLAYGFTGKAPNPYELSKFNIFEKPVKIFSSLPRCDENDISEFEARKNK